MAKVALSLLPSAPDVVLSIAPDHDEGLPSFVLYDGAVTAMQIALSALGFSISARATACSVMAPYNDGS